MLHIIQMDRFLYSKVSGRSVRPTNKGNIRLRVKIDAYCNPPLYKYVLESLQYFISKTKIHSRSCSWVVVWAWRWVCMCWWVHCCLAGQREHFSSINGSDNKLLDYIPIYFSNEYSLLHDPEYAPRNYQRKSIFYCASGARLPPRHGTCYYCECKALAPR